MTASETRATFGALGSTAVVATTEPSGLRPACEAVQTTVAEFDLACSRFRTDSELFAVNLAAGSPVAVGDVLLDAVQAALRAAQMTDGDVDPTIGEALLALGYDEDFASLSSRPTLSIARVPGWRAVHVDRQARTVRVALGVRLDLGATAKALAADRSAAAASAAAGCGVLVSLGGDISLAGPAPEPGWHVRVTDDHRSGPDAPGQSITVRSGGLATSSTTVRRWQAGHTDVHHLVDPRTGLAARVVWRTVSVAAASCLDANIATTAAIIRGDRAVGWLTQCELPSRLVGVDGTVRHLAGWPTDGDDLAEARGAPGPHAVAGPEAVSDPGAAAAPGAVSDLGLARGGVG